MKYIWNVQYCILILGGRLKHNKSSVPPLIRDAVSLAMS